MKETSNPAYGMISAIYNNNGSRSRLFGTAVPGYNCIRIVISAAALVEDDSAIVNCVRETKRLISVDVSPLQFAQFMTTSNRGSGVPCTITWLDGHSIDPPPDPTIPRERVAAEFREKMAKIKEQCANFVAEAKLMHQKASINKSDRDTFVHLAEDIVRTVTSKLPYITDKFAETVDAMLAEIEANKSCAPPAPPI